MRYFTIMPLDLEHIEEICEDIKRQYEDGVADCALFVMTLFPEGNPPAPKAEILTEKYIKFQSRLKEMGLKSGVLVQATIGHDRPMPELFPFQRYQNLNNGELRYCCCPEDDGFCDYIKSVMQTIARTNPDMIMVDDDFRLMFREGRGCACPIHMEKFNRLAGTDMSRAELYEIIEKRNDESRKYTDIFVKTQEDSLIKAARVMREGIDSINPKIPGSFCGCGGNMEAAADVAKILAGEGNPVILRVNNATYLTSNPRAFSRTFFRGATDIARIKDKVDFILDETDTWPQNRYSTSARALHAHHIGNILEGCVGAKHWITRLCAYEPKSGEYYRKAIKENRGLYDELAKIVPDLSWKGCRIPMQKKAYYDLADPMWATEEDGWSMHVLERYGFPMYYSAESGGVVFLDGDADKKFSNDEIMEFFNGVVVLDSVSAERLAERGFSDLIGVTIREWTGAMPCVEMIEENHSLCNVQDGAKELVPMSEDVRVLSKVCYTADSENYTPLFAGVTEFKNKMGGTTVVFCGSPKSDIINSFSWAFLTESRKAQFADILKRSGEMPVYYPDDAEVYLKAADMSDGALFCAVFNLSLDTLDEIPLVTEREFEKVERILADGSRKECTFKKEEGKVIVDVKAEVLNPVILILK